jgi:hypothetical protein
MTTENKEFVTKEFEDWWAIDGQYGRAGGGQYEKTFAFNAWVAAVEASKGFNTRERFRAKGDLWNCTNPAHDFQLGKLMGQWQWANECWSEITEGLDGKEGKMLNFGLCLGKVIGIDDRYFYKIIIWRFRLIFAFLK